MDGVGNAVGALFLVVGTVWQLLAGLIVVVAGYVVMSMTFGYGVGALRARMRRRRAAERVSPDADIDH